MMETVNKKLVYEVTDRNYSLKCIDTGDKGDYNFEIYKADTLIRTFNYAAYKAYNFSSHFRDIVDTEMWKQLPKCVRVISYKDGYKMATWNGF